MIFYTSCRRRRSHKKMVFLSIRVHKQPYMIEASNVQLTTVEGVDLEGTMQRGIGESFQNW